MAYVRSDIVPKVAEVVRKLSEDDRQPTVGELVDAVVEAGICGRGVAQQILAELRRSRATGTEGGLTTSEASEPLPDDIETLLQPLDDLHRRIDECRASVGRSMASSLAEMKASFGVLIADQSVAGRRADDDNRAEIARLEAELVRARDDLTQASTKMEEDEHQRADLYARLVEADEATAAHRAQVEVLAGERSRCRDEAEGLRVNLDGHRRDLDAARQAEGDLRAELRRMAAETIARHEHEALQSRLAATEAALAEERTRNAELHAQVLRLVGAMTGPAETTTALPA